jgi:beta-galactosidase
LIDAAGTPIPDTTTVVHFTTTGPATILASDNGNLLDHEPFQSPDHTLYNGTAIAILRATAATGAITITATAAGIPPTTLTLHAAPAQPPLVPRSF